MYLSWHTHLKCLCQPFKKFLKSDTQTTIKKSIKIFWFYTFFFFLQLHISVTNGPLVLIILERVLPVFQAWFVQFWLVTFKIKANIEHLDAKLILLAELV